MKLVIHKERATRIPRTRLHSLFAEVMRREGLTRHRSTVNLVFTGNPRLQALNREFRRKDKPTDVLSFNLDEVSESGGVFGEVYISVATAGQQARTFGHSLAAEYLRLACHGFYHLCGYDHQTESQAAGMESRERAALESVMPSRRIGCHV